MKMPMVNIVKQMLKFIFSLTAFFPDKTKTYLVVATVVKIIVLAKSIMSRIVATNLKFVTVVTINFERNCSNNRE